MALAPYHDGCPRSTSSEVYRSYRRMRGDGGRGYTKSDWICDGCKTHWHPDTNPYVRNFKWSAAEIVALDPRNFEKMVSNARKINILSTQKEVVTPQPTAPVVASPVQGMPSKQARRKRRRRGRAVMRKLPEAERSYYLAGSEYIIKHGLVRSKFSTAEIVQMGRDEIEHSVNQPDGLTYEPTG